MKKSHCLRAAAHHNVVDATHGFPLSGQRLASTVKWKTKPALRSTQRRHRSNGSSDPDQESSVGAQLIGFGGKQ